VVKDRGGDIAEPENEFNVDVLLVFYKLYRQYISWEEYWIWLIV